MSKPAVLAMRAISIERASRTVIDDTTSPRASLSLTGLRRMSLAATRRHSGYAANALGLNSAGRGYARIGNTDQPPSGLGVS